MEYIDGVLIKLRRQYSKDEYISSLLKKISELEMENGKLVSERDESIYKMEKALAIDNNVKSRFGQMKLCQNMKNEIKSLRDKCRNLSNENSRMFQKIVEFNKNN